MTTAKSYSAMCHSKLMVGLCVSGVVITRSYCMYEAPMPMLCKPARAPHLMKPPVPVLVDKLSKKEKLAAASQVIGEMCTDYVKDQFAEAIANSQFLCMQPFDSDHPLHGVIVARDTLECHDPLE